MSQESFLQATQERDVSGHARATPEEALGYANYTLDHWLPTSDTYVLKYGSSILPLVSAVSSVSLATKLLAREKLGGLRFSSMVFIRAAVAVPAGMASLVFHKLVLDDILLGETPCSICVQVRSASFQVAAGTILGGASAFVVSHLVMTTLLAKNIPSVWSRPGLAYLRQLAVKSRGLLLSSLLANLIAGFGLCVLEQRSWWYINQELQRRLDAANKHV
ncbi:uncharacterized protein LOC131887907 [Tigriopus californicus]|uniref:uncharacterized protein LOC131887907 n=1 Tax=Tigriopus californicus TaxID=6832 RepID=UPI0027DA6CD3|nr:uncharacterized protein LOC131887907 [Tigriopus californicus]|eukprot:TCALIF_04936-PA protein Name:"Protein of unknown function" AED:0.41 eAED:0.41 QI:0/-1/0/1/-1/1/1/0/218